MRQERTGATRGFPSRYRRSAMIDYAHHMPDRITVHFDISGLPVDCAAFFGLIGFPVSTSLTAAEQEVEAAALNKTTKKIVDVADDLKALGKT